MTDEQKYFFDIQGYLVLEGVLTPAQVQQMQGDMAAHGIANAENDPGKSRFGDFLGWGPAWRGLIDHPRVLPCLLDMLGPKFRLDHAYGMAMSHRGARGGEGLHHQAAMFPYGCFYISHAQGMHNGLIVVSYTLCDVPEGAGGFCCIPGSHKALFPPPKDWNIHNNPLLKHVTMKAGDVVIFTESLTHGTLAWNAPEWERRAVLLKYTPGYMQWAQGPMASDIAGLTDRQKAILRGAFVWERPAFDLEEQGVAK